MLAFTSQTTWKKGYLAFNITVFRKHKDKNDNVECCLWYINTFSDSILMWLMMIAAMMTMMTQNTRKLNKNGSHSCENKWWHSQIISISPKWRECIGNIMMTPVYSFNMHKVRHMNAIEPSANCAEKIQFSLHKIMIGYCVTITSEKQP